MPIPTHLVDQAIIRGLLRGAQSITELNLRINNRDRVRMRVRKMLQDGRLVLHSEGSKNGAQAPTYALAESRDYPGPPNLSGPAIGRHGV